MTALSADRPSIDPKDDLFGHASFAKNLADSICRYPGSNGLVLALYGPWGSGKSTVLGYVGHYIEQQPEEDRPVVVSFNPWWFSGQENLARAFLGQLQAVPPNKRTLLSKFLQHTRSQTVGDWAVRLQPRLNPTWLESYLDTAACAERLAQLTRKGAVPSEATEAVSQFLKEFEMLKAGKNPDGLGAFDD